MLLTPEELLAAARRARDYDDLMLELSGLAAGIIPRFSTPGPDGLPPKDGETSAELAWRRYLDLTDSTTRQLADVRHTIEEAFSRSEQRMRQAGEPPRAAREAHEQILCCKQRADYYAERMQSGEMLSVEDLQTIRQDLDAMSGLCSGGDPRPERGRAGDPVRASPAARTLPKSLIVGVPQPIHIKEKLWATHVPHS